MTTGNPKPAPHSRSWGAAATVGLVLVLLGVATSEGIRWAADVEQTAVPSTPIVAPSSPGPVDTSPQAPAKIAAGAQAQQAQAVRDAQIYAADRAAEEAQRSGRRTFLVAIGAGVLAALGFGVNALTLAHSRATARDERTRHREELKAAEERQREQLDAEQRRADRLQVTDLFNSAADKLGAADDATRTAAVLIFERLYTDAALLLAAPNDGSVAADGQLTSLRRSIIETLCGYVRERSRSHSQQWHSENGGPTGAFLHEDYRSPPSLRTSIAILGRLTQIPDGVDFDLTASHLSHVSFLGTYFASLLLSRASLRQIDARDARIVGDARFDGATIAGSAGFLRAEIVGDAWFDGAEILGDVLFSSAQISGSLLFDNVQIAGNARFGGSRIAAGAWFAEAKIRGGAWFNGAEIANEAFFDSAEIGGDARFTSAKLGSARFVDAKVSGNARFERAEIAGDMWFNGAEIGEDAQFDDANIFGSLRFDTTRIAGSARFPDARVVGNANFQSAVVGGTAYFGGAVVGAPGKRSFLDLRADWRGRAYGLDRLFLPGVNQDPQLDGATFAFAEDDPRTWESV